jgi:hypothetical protein
LIASTRSAAAQQVGGRRLESAEVRCALEPSAGCPVRPSNKENDDRDEGKVHPEVRDTERGRACDDGTPGEGEGSVERNRERERAQPDDPRSSPEEPCHKDKGKGGVEKVGDRHAAEERDGLRKPALRRRGKRKGRTRGERNQLVACVQEKVCRLEDAIPSHECARCDAIGLREGDRTLSLVPSNGEGAQLRPASGRG